VASARKASANRKDGAKRRGVQSGDGRGPVARAASGADTVAGVSAGKRLDTSEDGAGVGNGSLASVDETVIASASRDYSRLRLKAEAALELLVSGPGVPPNVRAAAVRTALELVGAIGSRAKDQRDQEDRADDLDPERLSIEDIDREIGKLGRV
jgi:hypothetical protein